MVSSGYFRCFGSPNDFGAMRFRFDDVIFGDRARRDDDLRAMSFPLFVWDWLVVRPVELIANLDERAGDVPADGRFR